MTTTLATCTKQVCAMNPDGSHELRPCRLEPDHSGVCRYAVEGVR